MSSSIDHVVYAIRDLKAGHEFFQQLGFTLTDLAVHPFGTGNHLAMFERSFIELLGVLDKEVILQRKKKSFSFSTFNLEFLEQQEGISALVISTEDADADYKRFLEDGLEAYPPFRFARKATLRDGREVEVAFSIAFVLPEDSSRMAFFVCQHHYPEYSWLQGNPNHSNTATGIYNIDIVCENPSNLLPFFMSLLNGTTIEKTEGCIFVKTAKESISLCTASYISNRYNIEITKVAAPFIAAMTIKVLSLDKLKNSFQKTNTAFKEMDGQLIIAAKDAFGVLLIFED